MRQVKHFLPVTQVVIPPDEAAAAQVLHEAARTDTAVYPIGGGTNLAYGLRPDAAGHRTVHGEVRPASSVSRRDLTVTVQAGLPVAELDAPGLRAAAGCRSMSPSPSWPRSAVSWQPTSSDRGATPTAPFVTTCWAFRAVDGQGEVFSGGGKVVKNAAGYNLPRLLVGSLGTLGVITQVTLDGPAAPARLSAIVVCDVREFERAECLLAGLSRSRTLPVAIELLAGRPRAGCPFPPALPGAVARLLVGFDGSQAEVDWMVAAALPGMGGGGGDPRAPAASYPRPVQRRAGSAVELADRFLRHLLIHVLPSDVVGVVRARLARLVPGASIQAHAGSGVIRVCWSRWHRRRPTAGCSPPTSARSSVRRWPPPAAAWWSWLRPTARSSASADVWGLPVDGTDIMQAIRSRFDPKGILNPGRFIFSNR